MKAYKCDRCGAFYEPYDENGQISVNGMTLIQRGHVLGQTIDLCKRCASEFEYWFLEGYEVMKER